MQFRTTFDFDREYL